MTEKYYRETSADKDLELDPLTTLLSDWTDPEAEEEEFRSDFFAGLAGRRGKAAFVLTAVWLLVLTLHLVNWGSWVVTGLVALTALQILRLVGSAPEVAPPPLTENASLADATAVSLVVAAKNEAAVIGRLIVNLCELDYPTDKYEVWAIDDCSTDATPQILSRLAQQYPHLKVIRRPPNAQGGKSGALNQVLPLTAGEIIGVFDADAQVPVDLLRRVIPLFAATEMGAVQVRKAIANASENFWTKGQMAEMALDSYLQQQRIALGGIGELRGNGQFARRSALKDCGAWNEHTITDDLDLTVRLHLEGWKIGLLLDPAVSEEGVTRTIALWHQRNRWAEGGYQRYLDYWRFLLRCRMGWSKKLDLAYFMFMQYLLPTAAVPDFLIAVARHQLPLLTPLTGLALSFSFWGMFVGLYRTRTEKNFSLPQLGEIFWQTVKGTIYMMHWLVIIPSITARMSVRPKRLKWVKTVHQGLPEESFEF